MASLLALTVKLLLIWIAVLTHSADVCIWGRMGSNSAINGLYTYEGIHNNKPYYRKYIGSGCSTYYIYWTGSRFNIYTSLGSSYYYAYCTVTSDVADCNTGSWYIAQNGWDSNVYAQSNSCPLWNCDKVSTPSLSNSCSVTFDESVDINAWRSSSNGWYWYFDPWFFNWVCNNQYSTPSCPSQSYYAKIKDGWWDLSKGQSINLDFEYPNTNRYTVNCISNPTPSPTNKPTTNSPTAKPTDNPTLKPSVNPSKHPTFNPSNNPTLIPTNNPTIKPTGNPTMKPTSIPTKTPSVNPTIVPTNNPTKKLTQKPTNDPTEHPTKNPSIIPTNIPTNNPSINPTFNPSSTPTLTPTNNPSNDPSTSPIFNPSNTPTQNPSINPTFNPSSTPTNNPSNNPSIAPTFNPSRNPTRIPTNNPSDDPSISPTFSPSDIPTQNPSIHPTFNPSGNPTPKPTDNPITPGNPTVAPSDPTNDPTKTPSNNPTQAPSNNPSQTPSNNPTQAPSNNPSQTPSPYPTQAPSNNPSSDPSNMPTVFSTNVSSPPPTQSTVTGTTLSTEAPTGSTSTMNRIETTITAPETSTTRNIPNSSPFTTTIATTATTIKTTTTSRTMRTSTEKATTTNMVTFDWRICESNTECFYFCQITVTIEFTVHYTFNLDISTIVLMLKNIIQSQLTPYISIFNMDIVISVAATNADTTNTATITTMIATDEKSNVDSLFAQIDATDNMINDVKSISIYTVQTEYPSSLFDVNAIYGTIVIIKPKKSISSTKNNENIVEPKNNNDDDGQGGFINFASTMDYIILIGIIIVFISIIVCCIWGCNKWRISRLNSGLTTSTGQHRTSLYSIKKSKSQNEQTLETHHMISDIQTKPIYAETPNINAFNTALTTAVDKKQQNVQYMESDSDNDSDDGRNEMGITFNNATFQRDVHESNLSIPEPKGHGMVTLPKFDPIDEDEEESIVDIELEMQPFD